jgi:hypothetical protein
MNPTVRNVLAVLAGLVAGVVAIMLLEMVGWLIYPPTPDLEPAEVMANSPIGALLMVELAAALGSLVAGAVAAKLGVGKPMVLAAIAGVVLTLGGIASVAMVPHPMWFVVLSTLTFVPMALLGGRLVAGRAASSARPASG